VAAVTAPTLILHHYGFSSFSEKIRLVLGLKNLAWYSVTIPSVAPKPKLTMLTGGYRHTPVLQIGADIYCDTRLIARELDRRFPAPELCPPRLSGLAFAIEAWAESELFWPIARYVSGQNAELTPEMNADRAALRGKRPASVERLKAVARESFNLLQTQLPRIENMLSDGRSFLVSEQSTIADFACYHGLWFLSAMKIDCSAALDGFPATLRWMQRIRSIGHGIPSDLAADDALGIARSAAPDPARPSSAAEFDPGLRSEVSVRPDGYATDAVRGELVFCDRNEIAIRRNEESLGELIVHFPRVGYSLKLLRNADVARPASTLSTAADDGNCRSRRVS
jgi:glutathione S-transferase